MPDTQKFPIAWKTWDSVFKNIDKFLGYANMKNFRGKKNLENQFGIQKPGLQAALIPRFQAIFTAKDWLQHRWPGFFFW